MWPCLWVWPSAAREGEQRAEAKLVRGELVRLELELEMVRWEVVINISIEGRLARILKARLLSGELKRGKSFRRKARKARRAQEDKEDREAVTKSGEPVRHESCHMTNNIFPRYFQISQAIFDCINYFGFHQTR